MQLRDIGASDIDDPFLPNSGRTYLVFVEQASL
jgi:hypothetical protein